MNALAVLYLVLPFPMAFIIHDAEEVIVQHRWMTLHRAGLSERMPWLEPMIARLAQLDTRAFAVAALEELVVLLMVTAYVLIQGRYCLEVWAALFMAFSIHLVVHIGQALLVRGYVPGLITALLLLPFAGYGMWSIWLVMTGWEMLMWGVIGVIIMVLNLHLAHWIGLKLK